MTVSAGSTITTSSYNTIRDTITQILNPTAAGYGRNLRKSTTATTNIVGTQAHWDLLYSDINRAIIHQTGSDIPGIAAPATGTVITAAYTNALEAAAQTAVANSLTVHSSQLTTRVSTATFVDIPWDTDKQLDRIYTWRSTLEAAYHFNLGGSIVTTIDALNGIPYSIPDQSFLNFVSFARDALAEPYTREKWLSFASTSTTYSTATDSGVFTATVTYTKDTGTVTVSSSIEVPAGITPPIGILPVSSSTLYYSVDAIPAIPPNTIEDRKILTATALNPFLFSAGTRSAPQLLTLKNEGAESLTVNSIESTNNGVFGYVVSTATNLTEENPFIVPLPLPLTLAPDEEYRAVVYYTEPTKATTEIGTFYNAVLINSDASNTVLTVPTVQQVSAPEFDFNLYLTDLSQEYTYASWQAEYGLSAGDRTLGETFATIYYLSNTDFGIIDGVRRYGLYRKPDSENLKFWVDYTKANGGDPAAAGIRNAFFRSIDAATTDNSRARTANKFFDSGFGYGDFYDRTLVATDLSSGSPKEYQYTIEPLFGTLEKYTISLSAQAFNNSPSEEAVAAFRASGLLSGFLLGLLGLDKYRDPRVIFTPVLVTSTGTYSTDVTVTVDGIDLTGAAVTKSKTVNLSLNLTSLADRNIVNWTSGFETDNAVMGISYDRIGGQLYLTIGLGSGSDGSPTLNNNNYSTQFVNIGNLGITGDEKWGTFPLNYGKPQYYRDWGTYSAFLNTYGVWPTSKINVDGTNTSFGYSYPRGFYLLNNYKFTAPSAGTYTVEFGTDDRGYVAIDGITVVDRRGTGSSENWTRSWTGTVNITSTGEHTVTISVYNQDQTVRGNPGALGVTIKDPGGNVVWSTLDTVRSIPPYQYWQEVYRIPIETGVARTYKAVNYLVKNDYPVNNVIGTYSQFFGDGGNFLTVDSDGKGNLSFTWNGISVLSGDASVNRTVVGIPFLPYLYSYFPSRRRQGPGAVEGASTQRLVGMTLAGPRYNTVPTPGYGRIEVQSNVYDNIARGQFPYLKINGSLVSYNYNQRGHTLAVINPLTAAVESMVTYDTWGTSNSTALTNALNAVPDGKVIAIISYDATTLNTETRNVLRNRFGSSFTSTWARSRIAHSFIGRAGDPTFGARERISSSTDLAQTYTFWPTGPISDLYAGGDTSFEGAGVGDGVGDGFGLGEGSDGGGGGGGGDCFTANSLVMMADGTTKEISTVRVGDRVLNHDGTRINTVRFIEKVLDTHWDYLYSPHPGLEPFATINHPLYIDGKLSVIDPGSVEDLYPWLGDLSEIKDSTIVPAQGEIVYNLWVGGDGTYQVNGYGTTSIVGDGGFLRQCWEQGLLAEEEVLSAVDYFTKQGPEVQYGAYIINRYVTYLDAVPFNQMLAVCIKKPAGKFALKTLAKGLGKVAKYIKRKQGK